MKYLVFTLGIAIIVVRCIGITIDLYSLGFFIIISVFVQLKNINHLSEFSWLGFNIKFNKDLKELSEETENIESKLDFRVNKEKTISGIDEGDSYNEQYLNFSGQETIKYDFRNPKSTLIEIAISIEKTLRNISRETLITNNNFPIATKRIIIELLKKKLINDDVSSAFNRFWNLRNNVIHGLNNSFGEIQIYSLVDSGLKILNILNLLENNIRKGIKIDIFT